VGNAVLTFRGLECPVGRKISCSFDRELQEIRKGTFTLFYNLFNISLLTKPFLCDRVHTDQTVDAEITAGNAFPESPGS
jgi:hypothetical protein